MIHEKSDIFRIDLFQKNKRFFINQVLIYINKKNPILYF